VTPQLYLRPGDILLYHPTPFQLKHFWTWPFGQLIRRHTGHAISHVEVYDGQRFSWASRDGKGVNRYPLRLSELSYVLRPTMPLDLRTARAWATGMIGTPYGWLALAEFLDFSIHTRGIVCSPFVASWLRQAGWNVFPEDPVDKIAPYQFLDLVGPECQVAYTFTADPTTETDAV
jgi:cell wall-associated NlpC family hydrolase